MPPCILALHADSRAVIAFLNGMFGSKFLGVEEGGVLHACYACCCLGVGPLMLNGLRRDRASLQTVYCFDSQAKVLDF